MRIVNRREAGRQLGKILKERGYRDPLVLALPRGGVPVGFEIARKLSAPLEVLVARKVGAPGHAEFGIGAVTEGGYSWIDPASAAHFTPRAAEIEENIAKELLELQRRIERYRGGRPLPDVRGRTVIVADDGLATGVTARVACAYLRKQGAREVILAVPVCAPDTARIVRREVKELLCLLEPDPFYSVGQFYEEFEQLEDDEVLELLSESRRKRPRAS